VSSAKRCAPTIIVDGTSAAARTPPHCEINWPSPANTTASAGFGGTYTVTSRPPSYSNVSVMSSPVIDIADVTSRRDYAIAPRLFGLSDAVQFEAMPDEVDHWTPESHWCADCWHWVVDCEHLRDPLAAEHHAVGDPCIRSLAYDRKTQCLE